MPATKRKLVEAAIRLILARGFTATGVDAICTEAGVTKGAFFHYFKSKEDVGVATLEAWGEFGMSIYSAARAEADPLDQLHRLFDIMENLAAQPGDPLACVVGMTAQEMATASPALRLASHRQWQLLRLRLDSNGLGKDFNLARGEVRVSRTFGARLHHAARM